MKNLLKVKILRDMGVDVYVAVGHPSQKVKAPIVRRKAWFMVPGGKVGTGAQKAARVQLAGFEIALRGLKGVFHWNGIQLSPGAFGLVLAKGKGLIKTFTSPIERKKKQYAEANKWLMEMIEENPELRSVAESAYNAGTTIRSELIKTGATEVPELKAEATLPIAAAVPTVTM